MKWRTEDKMRFGRNVAALRGEKQLSQQALAKKVGLCYHTIFGIENGRHQPRGKTLYALQRFFGHAKLPMPDEIVPRLPTEPAAPTFPLSEPERQAQVCAKIAPELIACLYDYLVKQDKEGHISVGPGGAIKKSGV